MMAPLPRPETWRLPGCSTTCREMSARIPPDFGWAYLVLHDPDSHERYAMDAQPVSSVVAGPLAIDLRSRQVTLNGEAVCLTATEYRILHYLASRPGVLCHKDDMLTAIWGPEYVGEHHLIRVNIARVRRAIGDGRQRLIQTQIGQGYMLRGEPVERVTQEEPIDAPELPCIVRLQPSETLPTLARRLGNRLVIGPSGDPIEIGYRMAATLERLNAVPSRQMSLDALADQPVGERGRQAIQRRRDVLRIVKRLRRHGYDIEHVPDSDTPHGAVHLLSPLPSSLEVESL